MWVRRSTMSTAGIGRAVGRCVKTSSWYWPRSACANVSRLGVADPSTHTAPARCARVIAHALVLLERAVVLLVDDDHAEVGERREHRRPRADRDPGLAAAQPRPLAEPRGLAEPGVQDRDLVAEPGPEPGGELRRQ